MLLLVLNCLYSLHISTYAIYMAIRPLSLLVNNFLLLNSYIVLSTVCNRDLQPKFKLKATINLAQEKTRRHNMLVYSLLLSLLEFLLAYKSQSVHLTRKITLTITERT